MLNNARLKRKLDLNYQTKIALYDTRCAGCPDANIRIKLNDEVSKKLTLKEAIDYATVSSYAVIVRGCSSEGGHTLEEIMKNSCVLWGADETDVPEDHFEDYEPSKEELNE
jgi:hypothetical protein